MMKKTLFILSAVCMLSTNVFAEETKAGQVDTNTTKAVKTKTPAKALCKKCGTVAPKEYKTEHMDANGEKYCSVDCLAKSMAKDKKIAGIKVIDNSTLTFVDVIRVWYVVESSEAGATNSKYAFTKKSDAEKFAKKFGGKLVTFYTLIK